MNVGALLKAEINRLSARAVRAQTKAMRAQVSNHRHTIAVLRKEVLGLKQQMARVLRGQQQLAKADRTEATPTVRFIAKGFKAWRARTGIAAEAIGGLVGVSTQAVYNWENGTSKPRATQATKLAELRAKGLREVRKLVAEAQRRVPAKSSKQSAKAKPAKGR